MKVEVRSKEVVSERIEPRPGGKQFQPFTKHTQQAYAHTVGTNGQPEAYPRQFRLSLEKPDLALEPGMYHLADGSFYVDRNGNLALGRLVLDASAPSALRKAS